MITTIVGCIENPNAARTLATVSSSDADSYTFDMKNIGGYGFVYIMVLLYPVLILSYKTKRIRLLPTIIMTTVILATVIYSEYTTALLLFVATTALFFTRRSLSGRGIVIVTILVILFLLFFTEAIADFLRWLGDISGSDAIASRLDALAGGAEGLEASEDNRIELYRMSLEQFFAHPLFGTVFASYRTNGGHSFILDNMAQYGIIGGIVMYSMYKRVFIRFFMPFKDKPGFGYVIWTFIQVIILSLVNTGMFLEVLCSFAPLLFFWIYGTETRTEEKNHEDTVDSQPISRPAG